MIYRDISHVNRLFKINAHFDNYHFAEYNEPVFVTKNGYGRLVVMDIDYYERTMRRIDEAALINRGISDYENGRIVDGKKSLKKLRESHGL